MRLNNPGLVLTLAITLVSAIPSQLKVKESIHPPRGWSKAARAPAGRTIELRIGLPQLNFKELERHLYEVSDPSHERYGDHLSKEDVEALVAPHPDSVAKVEKWIHSHGCKMGDVSHSPAKDWVLVKVPISTAEKMLNTEYHVWKHEDGDAIVRTTSYSLPHDLYDHIEVIQPTTMFARFKRSARPLHEETSHRTPDHSIASTGAITSASGARVDPSCNSTTTLQCLRQLYNAVGYKASDKVGNKIGIASYLGDTFNATDLQTFYQDQLPEAVGKTITLYHAGKGSDVSTPEGEIEANLDTQFASGIAFPADTTTYSTAGSPPFNPDQSTGPDNYNEPYAEWLAFILAQDSPPQTITTSYDDSEQTVPESYARRVCADFAQLGARGISLLFSSGDGGVGDGESDPAEHVCYSNDGKNTARFLPMFPSTCPFVTSVGGTIYVPEQAVFFSGGGFSNYFAQPAYQTAAVKKYLDGLPPGTYAGLYNPAGRGFPDVAAQGRWFKVFVEGSVHLSSGTSASSPAFAGFVALLNDARLQRGLKPLGFLNPMLYSVGVQGLNDITTGNNPGCGTQGFNATAGWDPLTGLGTPNFGKLKDIVLNY